SWGWSCSTAARPPARKRWRGGYTVHGTRYTVPGAPCPPPPPQAPGTLAVTPAPGQAQQAARPRLEPGCGLATMDPGRHRRALVARSSSVNSIGSALRRGAPPSAPLSLHLPFHQELSALTSRKCLAKAVT